LLQAGVSYVGGYQGAPVSHLLDVMVDAEDLLGDLGVHVETCTNEASAAAMLGASINYPLRGAVTWKSIVGTNVAADALSNLSSPGVVGGVMIILGEDYGEGASVIQERSYAYALKSSMWLLDPRPDLPTIVRMVEKGFELSEASHAPVMMELRIPRLPRHRRIRGQDQQARRILRTQPHPRPAALRVCAVAHPPALFVHERLKVEDRLPAAIDFIREHKLNEFIAGDLADIGIIVCGGLTSACCARSAARARRPLRRSRVPIYVLNVVYPLVPEEVRAFCAGKRAVLVVEEGSPDYIEQQINVELRRADIQTRVLGKGRCRRPANTPPTCCSRARAFSAEARPAGIDRPRVSGRRAAGSRTGRGRQGASASCRRGRRPSAPAARAAGVSAIKLMQRELGRRTSQADIGCHAFATFAPFAWATPSSATACRSRPPRR
jgi:indolepyruvate ferredoxin oxidoreductase alpha subunit